MAVEFYRYFHADWIGHDRIESDFLINYFGFAWVQPLPGGGMYLLFFSLGVLAILIIMGGIAGSCRFSFWDSLMFSYSHKRRN